MESPSLLEEGPIPYIIGGLGICTLNRLLSSLETVLGKVLITQITPEITSKLQPLLECMGSQHSGQRQLLAHILLGATFSFGK
jgi:hypothetical protein